MRKFCFLPVFFLAIVLLSSCGTGNKFASSFGKRKYTKGFYRDMPSSYRMPATASAPQTPKPVGTYKLTSHAQANRILPGKLILAKHTGKPLAPSSSISSTDYSLNSGSMQSLTRLVTIPLPIDSNDTNLDSPKGGSGDINYYSIAGFAVSTTGVVIAAIAETLTLLTIILLVIGAFLCVYSLTRDKIYLDWLAVIGLSFIVILFTLILI